MELKLEEGATFDFCTHHPETGAATDADSTPSAEVFEDATDTTVVALTVTKRTSKTGNYRVPVTAASGDGFESGKTYNVVASATVNSIAAKGVIGRFKVRAQGTDDLAATGANMTLADGAITAATIASEAIQAAKIQDGALTAAKFASGAFDAVWSVATRTLTAFSDSSGVTTLLSRIASALTITGGKVTVGTNDDKTGYTLHGDYDAAKTAAQAGDAMTLTGDYDAAKTAASQASVDALASTLGTPVELDGGANVADNLVDIYNRAGEIGNRLQDVESAVGSPLQAGDYTAPLDAAGVRDAVGLASANLDTQLDALPTNSELATALGTADDAVLAAIAALNNLSAAAVNAEVDTALADAALATAANLATAKTAIDEIKAKTDTIPASPAAVGDIPTTAQIADKVLGRNLAGGSDGGRMVKDALRVSRNKVVIDGSTITVYAEDDTTPAWTGTVVRADLDALQSVDPA